MFHPALLYWALLQHYPPWFPFIVINPRFHRAGSVLHPFRRGLSRLLYLIILVPDICLLPSLCTHWARGTQWARDFFNSRDTYSHVVLITRKDFKKILCSGWNNSMFLLIYFLPRFVKLLVGSALPLWHTSASWLSHSLSLTIFTVLHQICDGPSCQRPTVLFSLVCLLGDQINTTCVILIVCFPITD